MKVIIDRFEGGFAVCEDPESRQVIQLKKLEIPKSAKEGTVLLLTEDGKWLIDKADTAERSSRIKSKMDDLWT
jgi:hypothetical protein